jgi:hypothetical protein
MRWPRRKRTSGLRVVTAEELKTMEPTKGAFDSVIKTLVESGEVDREKAKAKRLAAEREKHERQDVRPEPRSALVDADKLEF